MELDSNDRIIFIGDSITDCNRDYQALPARWNSWGDGYVSLINAYTTGVFPEKEWMVINKGVSGDRITDLLNRWDEDVIELRPDWVNIMIGINDVWRHFDGTFCQEIQVSSYLFESVYRKLIEKTISKVKGISLMSAFMVEKEKNDPMRKMVDEFNQITQKIALDYNLSYINVQALIDEFLQCQSSYVLSSDRVHPSLAGHVLIAKSWIDLFELKR